MKKIRILHLEDVQSDADLIHRTLRKANIEFECKLVDTRNEFVEALKSFHPDIIISDHSLPNFNSLEAMDELRSSEKKIPFILVTGAVSEDFAAIAIKKGADDYILKDRLQRLPNALLGALKKHEVEQKQQFDAQQLKNISEYSEDVICSVDREGRFIYVSKASEKIWGYKPEELIGISFYNLVYSEDIEPTQEIARQIINGTSVNTFENRYIRKNGTIVPLIWSSKWEEKEQTMFAIAKDATEHLLARKKVEESQRQYVHLVENLPTATYTCDSEGHIILYNNACVELWGRHPDKENDLWSGAWKIYDREGALITAAEYPIAKAIKEGRDIHGEEIIIERPDGTKRNVIPYPSPQFDDAGNVKGAINLVVDITDRKKIEEENNKLALIANLTVNAVVVTDPEGRITWVNNGFERISEYSMEEVIGQKPGDLLQGKYTDQTTVQHMRDCRKKGEGFRVEILNYTKSGREYWLDIEVMPLKNTHQKLTGFMAIQQDISERKNSEKESKKLIDRLQSINNDLRQFSYIVSHNLRAPIARILGLANLFNLDPKDNKVIVNNMAEEAKNLDMVVKDINQIISAHDTNEEKRDEVIFDWELRQTLNLLRDEIEESNAKIHSDFSQISKIFSIKAYIQSIFYNLISNAIKFRSKNTTPLINIRSFADNDYIYVSIEDNGLGIDLQSQRQNIFGLYQRFHGPSYPGRGIGLNLVRAQAEALNGSIKIESAPGRGSKFILRLQKK